MSIHNSTGSSMMMMKISSSLQSEFEQVLKGELAKGRAAPVARVLVEKAAKVLCVEADKARQATFEMLSDVMRRSDPEREI